MLTIGVSRPARVVQVGEAVGEAGAEVQQRRGRLAGHARVAIGGAGHHALEQAEHAAHPGDRVERRDEMHLRRAGVGEADIDAPAGQGMDQASAPFIRSSPMLPSISAPHQS